MVYKQVNMSNHGSRKRLTKRDIYPSRRYRKRSRAPSKVDITRYNRYSGNAFPERIQTTMSYFQTITLLPSTIYAANAFALNGAYDPDITGTGHQPMGFDQYMLIYQKYRVKSADIICTFFNGTGTGNAPAVGVQFTDNVTFIPSGGLQQIVERGHVKYAQMPTYSSGTTVQLRKRFDYNKWFGNTTNANNENWGDDGNNPLELVYAQVFAISNPYGVSANAVNCNVQIKYNIEFFSQKQMNQS